MGDIAVENPANNVQPHKKTAPSAIPTIDNFEGLPADGGDEYANLKKLQRQLEYASILKLCQAPLTRLQIHPAPRRVHQG
jgi:26S proteasome regulatory subunit T3